ncbi:MAG: hypothetical protein ACLGID_05815 [Gammaproteobacteria bacterium]
MSRKRTPASSAPAAAALAGEAVATAAAPAPTAAAVLPAPATPTGGEENTTAQDIEGASTADKANTAAPEAPVSEVVSATTAPPDATATPDAAAPAGVEESVTAPALDGATGSDSVNTDAPAGGAANSTVEPDADPVPTTTYRVVGLDLMIDGKLIPENGTVELDYEPSAKTLRRLEPVIKKKEGNQ